MPSQFFAMTRHCQDRHQGENGQSSFSSPKRTGACEEIVELKGRVGERNLSQRKDRRRKERTEVEESGASLSLLIVD